MLVMNMFLALVWAAVTGEVTMPNLVAGFVLGYGILWIASRSGGPHRYFERVGTIVTFTLFFLKELFLATIRVAVDIATPWHLMKPAILAVPCDAESATEITTLANVITLTPGTLVLDVSPDGKTLYVHAMYADDLEGVRRDIRQGLGRRVREVFR